MAKECWVLDVLHFYYVHIGHPSPAFRCFDPSIHNLIRRDEDTMHRGMFSCYFMGKGMRDYIVNSPPTWHLLKFHDAEPVAGSGSGGQGEGNLAMAAVEDSFEGDARRTSEYLILQIVQGGAYAMDLGTAEVYPLIDCSSIEFSTTLVYNGIKKGDIVRGVEPVYVPDLIAFRPYLYPADTLIRESISDPDSVFHLITDHVRRTSPVQKFIRLRYGNQWKAIKKADLRLVDYITHVVKPWAN